MHIVEGLASQRPSAGAADEAVGVVKVAHGLTGLSGTLHLLPAGVADAYQSLEINKYYRVSL